MRDALVALIAASLVATAATQAREVRVMSAGATAPAYVQLVPAFEAKTKQKAVTLATSTGVGTSTPNSTRDGATPSAATVSSVLPGSATLAP